jgi:membrane-associated phospholipid phosphatase
MESLLDLSLQVTHWLQSNYPQAEPIFSTVSIIGRVEIYLIVLTLIYWCLEKRLGATLTYLLAITVLFNSILKHAIRDPRPYWIDPGAGLSSAADYAMPSGHAQIAAVFYLTIAAWFRRTWLWLLCLAMVFLMALSRVYLGVHDIPDVVAGILLGALTVAAYFLWERYAAQKFRKRILGQRLLAAIAFPLLLVLVYVAILLLTDQPGGELVWSPFIEEAERTGIINVVSTVGLLLGFGVGFTLEGSWVRFQVDGPVWKRGLRYGLGIIVALAIAFGLARIIPDDPLWLHATLEFGRTLALALWIAYYAPWLFVRLKLADATPKPEINLTL